MKRCEKYQPPQIYDEAEREKDWDCRDGKILIPEDIEALNPDEELMKELEKLRKYVKLRKSKIISLLRLNFQGKNLYDITEMCKWKTLFSMLFTLVVVFQNDKELITDIADIFIEVSHFPADEHDRERVCDFRKIAEGMLIAMQPFMRGNAGAECWAYYSEWHITDFLNFVGQQDDLKPQEVDVDE